MLLTACSNTSASAAPPQHSKISSIGLRRLKLAIWITDILVAMTRLLWRLSTQPQTPETRRWMMRHRKKGKRVEMKMRGYQRRKDRDFAGSSRNSACITWICQGSLDTGSTAATVQVACSFVSIRVDFKSLWTRFGMFLLILLQLPHLKHLYYGT
jgi:hypothetical protein